MKEVRSVAAVVPNYPSTSVLSANILPVYTRTRFTATSVEYAGTWFQFSLLTLYLFMFCCLLVCLSVCLHVYQFFVCLFQKGLCTKNLHALLRLPDSNTDSMKQTCAQKIKPDWRMQTCKLPQTARSRQLTLTL